MAKVNSTTGGIGFGGLLQLALIILKLCKVIDLSWWGVLIPFWMFLGVLIVLIISIYQVTDDEPAS